MKKLWADRPWEESITEKIVAECGRKTKKIVAKSIKKRKKIVALSWQLRLYMIRYG